MLSKVLKDASLELAPVPLRRLAFLSAPAAPRDADADATAEVAQFRTKIIELETALETQSRQSYAAGLRAGEESARQSLESGVRESVQRLAATIAELAATRSEIIHRAEADTVRLSIEIARRVLHRELSVDGSALEALIKAALEKLQAQEVHRVRVHPAQEKLLRTCLDQSGRGQSVAVVGDPLQPLGAAVFETSRGALDASVEIQLAEIERGLADQLEAHG
jgi:flagellar assembly protein FliH